MCNSCDLTVHSSTLTIKFLYAYENFTTQNVHFNILAIHSTTLKVYEIALTLHTSSPILQSSTLTGHFGSDTMWYYIYSTRVYLYTRIPTKLLITEVYLALYISFAPFLTPKYCTFQYIKCIFHYTVDFQYCTSEYGNVVNTRLKSSPALLYMLTQQGSKWLAQKNGRYTTDGYYFSEKSVFYFSFRRGSSTPWYTFGKGY